MNERNPKIRVLELNACGVEGGALQEEAEDLKLEFKSVEKLSELKASLANDKFEDPLLLVHFAGILKGRYIRPLVFEEAVEMVRGRFPGKRLFVYGGGAEGYERAKKIGAIYVNLEALGYHNVLKRLIAANS